MLLAEDSVQRLQDVKRIYVDSFGNGENADVIRSKVITQLVKSNQFEVVQTPEKADAILTGAGTVSQRAVYSASANGQFGNASGGTRFDATAGVQLVNKQQTILWADNVSNGRFSRSATSSLAENIVKNLLKAVSDAKKKSDPVRKQR